MKKPVVIGLAVVVLAAVVAGGYWWYQSRQDNGLTLYGNVDIRTVNLSFRVGGRVESLAVDEGDAIKAGQVLGELDHKPYEIALMQAKAGVSVAQAQYDLMQDVGVLTKRIVLQDWPHGFGGDGGWVEDYAQWLEQVFAQNE